MTDETRERQGRGEEVAQQRRRRTEGTLGPSYKMAIPEDVAARLKAEGRVARWANDDGNRLHNLTVKDDYDKVEGVDPVPVGSTADGKPMLAYLLSKPAEFIAEDRAKLEGRRRDVERAMLTGRVPVSPGSEITAPLQGQLGAQTYVDGASKLGRGNQIIE